MKKAGRPKKTDSKARPGFRRRLQTVGTVFGIVLIVTLLPTLCLNMVLIVKSYAHPEQVPTVFGIAPLIVQSGSMEPTIKLDDLIFTRTKDPDTIKKNDIITYQPLNAATLVTHRVVSVSPQNGKRVFFTKGDANSAADEDPVYGSQVVGVYFARLPGVGRIAMFLLEPIGMIVCVALPLLLFLAYDMLRRYFFRKDTVQSEGAEKEELERLRALAASLAEKGPRPAEGESKEKNDEGGNNEG